MPRQNVELVQYAPCGEDTAKAVVREVPIGERPPAVSVGVEA
jgi:hypothetical protein